MIVQAAENSVAPWINKIEGEERWWGNLEIQKCKKHIDSLKYTDLIDPDSNKKIKNRRDLNTAYLSLISFLGMTAAWKCFTSISCLLVKNCALCPSVKLRTWTLLVCDLPLAAILSLLCFSVFFSPFFAWERLGSLDCLCLRVIVPRDSASCSTYRGWFIAERPGQQHPPTGLCPCSLLCFSFQPVSLVLPYSPSSHKLLELHCVVGHVVVLPWCLQCDRDNLTPLQGRRL